MLPIKGIQKTSLIDYQPYTSAVIFIGGCNFRCPYCQNGDLVLRFKDLPTLSEKEICDFLKSKLKWLDAAVITGGEPTMYKELVDLIREIRKLGLKVKLDTNGTNPDMLWDMIEEGLLDYVAMDIKAPKSSYENVTILPVEIEKISKSVSLIMNSNIDYEFRTTVVPKLVSKDDMLRIAEWIDGAKRFAIQQFRAARGILDKAYEKEEAYKRSEITEIKKIMKPYIDEIIIRD